MRPCSGLGENAKYRRRHGRRWIGVIGHWQAGISGQKASVYEGGVRAPCSVRWPSEIEPGSTCDVLTSHVDWLPTFCEIADGFVPADRVIDGKSLVDALRGHAGQHHRFLYHTWDRYTPNPDRRWAISDPRWKLLGQFANSTEPDPSKWRLFDLHSDPGERSNIAGRHPEIVTVLRKEFVGWFDEATEGITYEPIPIPVGHPDQRSVELSPSWARLDGKNLRY